MHPTQSTTNDDGQTVAIGLLPDPFITSGPWVVHPYWDSLPSGSAVPLYDTPCKPVPVRELATSHCRAAHASFAANILASRSLERMDSALRTTGRRFPYAALDSDRRRWLADLPWSVLLGCIGFGVVWLTVELGGLDGLLKAIIVVATVACVLLLMAAQLIDRRRR